MDPNDLRRRLTLFNNNSPSLRTAAAPAPIAPVSFTAPKPQPVKPAPARPMNAPGTTGYSPIAPNRFKAFSLSEGENKKLFGIDVGQFMGQYGKTRKLSADKDYSVDPQEFLKQFDNLNGEFRRAYIQDIQKRAATDPVASKTYNFLQQSGRFKGTPYDFIQGSNEQFFGELNRGVLRALDFVIPGENTLNLETQAKSMERPAEYTEAGKAGEFAGGAQKLATDIAVMGKFGSLFKAGASKIPGFTAFVDKLQKGGKMSQATAKILAMLPSSLGGSTANVLQTAGRGEEQNVPQSILTGTAVDLALGGAGNMIRRGAAFFKGKKGADVEQVLQGLAKSNDPQAITKEITKLAPNADQKLVEELSAYISQETDPRAIRGALEALGDDIPLGGGRPTKAAQAAEEAAGTVGKKPAYERAMKPPIDPSIVPSDIPEKQLIELPQTKVGNAAKADVIPDAPTGTTPDLPNVVERGADGTIPRSTIETVANDIKAATPEAAPVKTEQAQAVEDVAKAQTGTGAPKVEGDGKTTAPEAAQGDIPSTVDQEAALGTKTVGDAPDTSQGMMPQKAEDIVPNADPETKKAVQQVLDSLNSADESYTAVTKKRAIEKAERGAKSQEAYTAAGGGEEGFRAKLKALKGKYSESDYQPISVDADTEKVLLDSVEKSKLRDFEKLNTQNALRKLWGSNPEKPTAGDVQYIRRHFNDSFGKGVGDEIAKSVEEALQSGKSIGDIAVDVAGLPRALMATGDLSGGFRQAMPLGTRFPKIWAKANVESVKYAFNPSYYKQEMQKLADSPGYNVIADKMGVDLTAIGAMQDEAFMGAGLAEKIPVAGIAVKAADRAYTGVLTKIRYDVANKLIKEAGGSEKFLKSMQELYGDKNVRTGLFFGPRTSAADRAMRAYGEVINTMTGRGGMRGGALDRHMKTASTLLFAPRLWAANLNRLNPAWYARLYRSNPQAAKLAAQTQGTFLLMAGSVLGLASAAGAQVGTDPRSADFGKIKVGNTRYDILGGQQQNIVQLARQWTGEKVNSETGEVDKLGDGYGAQTRFDLAFDMFENKANPLLAFGIKLMNTSEGDDGNPFVRKDQYGNDFNLGTEGLKLVTPLGIQGAVETSKDMGDPVKGTLMNAPSFFGVGVQTYGNTATKDKGVGSNGKLTYKGKITDDMVLDKNGEPLFDEKGKVIRAKFDDDATDLEKTAIKDELRRNALKSQFTRGQSKEDQALMKLSAKELKQYVEDGKIDQERYDQIQRLQKGSEDFGNDIEVPEGVKSKPAETFYKKWNSMTKKDQDHWLNEAPDANAQAIAKQLNAQRAKGLSEYKPSNALSKAYAEYEKDILSHPEYSDVDKRNKAKAFQAFAQKLNYSTDQRDIYAEGGSSDLRALIDNKEIGKADLDAAIKLDNELYEAGITGSLKFSRKFRNDFGYSVPDSVDGSGDGSGGSKRAYLSALLPDASTGSSAPVPKFSTKPRTPGISFKNVSLPRSSSNKKVSISL